jgi:hypothetical protein
MVVDPVYESVRAIDTEEAESTERMSHRDTETQRVSVSPCLRGWFILCGLMLSL